ncbi:hypothetical protein FHS95_000350 [Sphingomonas naasensis]|uniref:Spore coat protein U domain-containing protein n=1 Tax=Sphingomonas naasensis TaxID=1344951 RepID=A0A4S1WRB6_9SPHN|nr:hypothetical protein [Sphingomonas naasensis]NIJ18681.1 hypothetical protein [Sphingomonas naasensis]TGX45919.1 hypothetical protein E5A74_01730 [Sphingomonas naasensis]
MKRLALSLLAIAMAVCAVAQPARAQVTAYAAGQGAVNSVEVGVEVRASVRSRCGFATGGAPAGSIDQADFDQSGFSKDFAIQLNCSGASRIAVSSANGGMATQTAGANGYGTKAPYQVALKVVADNGTSATATCDAATLSAGGSCGFAGTAGSATGLRLAGASTKANGSYLRVSAPGYAGSAPLVAGRYADTLSITISVSP